jgi:hypothetical protein
MMLFVTVSALFCFFFMLPIPWHIEHIPAGRSGCGVYIVHPIVWPHRVIVSYQTHTYAPTQYQLKVIFFEDSELSLKS